MNKKKKVKYTHYPPREDSRPLTLWSCIADAFVPSSRTSFEHHHVVFHLHAWKTNKNISVLMQHWGGKSQDVTPYWFNFFHTRLLLEFLLNADCLPYLPYFLYGRSKGWLTLLLSDTVHSHLWTWAGCSNTGEHGPRSNAVPLGSFSEAATRHQTPRVDSRTLGLQRGIRVYFKFTWAFDTLHSSSHYWNVRLVLAYDYPGCLGFTW